MNIVEQSPDYITCTHPHASGYISIDGHVAVISNIFYAHRCKTAPEAKKNMKVFRESFRFSTRGEIDFVDLSDRVQDSVERAGVKEGLVHVFAPHATGMLILTEHEPSLLQDIENLLETLIPRKSGYQHPSNAHSHLRSVFLSPDKTLPVIDGRVILGTWQSLLFVETDVHPRQRTVIIQVLGE